MRVLLASLTLVCFLAGCQCAKPRARKEFKNHVKNIFSLTGRLDRVRVMNLSAGRNETVDSLLNEIARHSCFQKRMRKQKAAFAHLRLSGKLYDQMWQRSDSINARLENQNERIESLNYDKESIQCKIAKHRQALKSLSNTAKALQYTSDLIKTGSDLAQAQSELLSIETALIEPTLNQAIQRGELRLLQSDVFAARQVFLKDLLDLKLKLKLK